MRVYNLNARAIDVLYTLDGRLMPAQLSWKLGPDRSSAVFIDSSTPKGWYHYRAIRDSDSGNDAWIVVDLRVLVR
jgi:hypothetical protein